MGIRETINKFPAASSGVFTGVILITVAFIFWSQRSPADSSPGRAAYTIDDGKTWFVDVDNRITPFTKNGQTAVSAALFSSDGGKTKFVGYLQRNDPSAVQKLSKPNAVKRADLPSGEAVELGYSVQVKRPLSPNSPWIRMDSPEAAAITQPKSPSGQPATAVEP